MASLGFIRVTTNRVLPRRRPGGHVAARGIPLDVRHAVVLRHVHQLQVRRHVLLALGLLALKVEVVELEVGALLVADRGDGHKAALGRPVDGVVVLLFERAQVLEVADRVALGLLGAEEGNGCLGCHSRGADGLGCGDDDEAVALGLPGKVDDSILDSVNHLDRHTLLLDAEDLERGRLRLLGLGVPVDLDADVRAVRLPVQLGVRDAEEVEGPHDLLGRDTHQADPGGVAADLGGPEAEELLIRLDAVAAHGGGRPLKVHDAVNLDGRLVEQVHLGELVHRDGGALVQAGDVLVVGGPLEGGPGEFGLLLGGVALGGGGRILLGKGPERLGRLNIPDDVVLAVVVERQGGVAAVGDRDGAVRPGDQVLFVGGECDKVDKRVREAAQPGPRGTTPEKDALGVD